MPTVNIYEGTASHADPHAAAWLDLVRNTAAAYAKRNGLAMPSENHLYAAFARMESASAEWLRRTEHVYVRGAEEAVTEWNDGQRIAPSAWASGFSLPLQPHQVLLCIVTGVGLGLFAVRLMHLLH